MTINSKNFPIPSYYATIATGAFANVRNMPSKDLKQLAYNANYLAGNNQVALSMGDMGNGSFSGTAFPTTLSTSFRYMLIDPPNCFTRYWVWYYNNSPFSDDRCNIRISSSFNGVTYNEFQSLTGKNKAIFTESMLRATVVNTPVLVDTSVIISAGPNQFGNTKLISAFNQPAVLVNPTTQDNQYAVDVISNNANLPVYSTAYEQNSSIGGISKVVNLVSTSYIKNIWTSAKPVSFAGVNNWSGSSTTTNVPMFVTGSVMKNGWRMATVSSGNATPTQPKPLIFATQTGLTQSVRECWIYAYGAVQTAGNTGRVEFTASNPFGTTAPTSTFLQFVSTTPGWQSASLAFPTENLGLNNMNSIPPNFVDGFTGTFQVNLRKSTSIDSTAFTIWTLQVFETF